MGPDLRLALSELLPHDIVEHIADVPPSHGFDARDSFLGAVTDRRGVIATVRNWIEGQPVAAYHGSRLTEDELAQIRAQGLRMLRASERTTRLQTVLFHHPRWSDEGGKLQEAIQFVIAKSGQREARLHLTLSQSGLRHSFNHYLTHGSEFDGHVAHRLLGEDGRELLGRYGSATIFRLRVPGPEAMRACNPFGTLERFLPNLVEDVLDVWSYWLVRSDYSSADRKLDRGMIFNVDLPPEWIVDVTTIDDQEFGAS